MLVNFKFYKQTKVNGVDYVIDARGTVSGMSYATYEDGFKSSTDFEPEDYECEECYIVRVSDDEEIGMYDPEYPLLMEKVREYAFDNCEL